jgi:hypothetical protein
LRVLWGAMMCLLGVKGKRPGRGGVVRALFVTACVRLL